MFDFTWRESDSWKEAGGEDAIPSCPPDPTIAKASLLFWEEHCVECSIPVCYTTCRLFIARKDQKCARFAYGIYPNDRVTGLFAYGADIFFRRWAKLEAKLTGPPRTFPLDELRRYARWEERFERAANLAGNVLQPVNPQRRVNGAYAALRTHWLDRRSARYDYRTEPAAAFYIKFFNPGHTEFTVNVEFHQDRLVFRDGIRAKPGWNEKLIPVDSFRISPDDSGRILLSLANDHEGRLIFAWLDFVVLAPAPALSLSPRLVAEGEIPAPARKVKCVVWDLDNTLWQGVIGDAGAEGVVVDDRAVRIIRALDERGILQTIASKNTYQVAWAKIEALGLADYFLYPAIHWGPKSESLKNIAQELNINVDTFAFIDDSPFERAEVAAMLPQVRVFDVVDLEQLLLCPEFDVPITEASRERRLSYLAEAQRKQIAATAHGDFNGFLRSCDFVVEIGAAQPADRLRCLELLQRTNQLNLSTRRYSDHEFDELLSSPVMECFVLRCADRFGDYGLVGFCSIDVSGSVPTVSDFVLSCRVAQKRVEETFFRWYAQRALERGADRLQAVFIATSRNQPLRSALSDVPFEVVSTHSETEVLQMLLSDPIILPDVLRVVERASEYSRR